MDSFDKLTRSRVMSAVKSKGNKSTELLFITFLKSYKITGWRRNYPLKGKPDFVFPNIRLVIFTDGCFWHGHNCRNTTPKANSNYWSAKILKNKVRDSKINIYLKKHGWNVIRIWECKLKIDNWPSLYKKCSKYAANIA